MFARLFGLLVGLVLVLSLADLIGLADVAWMGESSYPVGVGRSDGPVQTATTLRTRFATSEASRGRAEEELKRARATEKAMSAEEAQWRRDASDAQGTIAALEAALERADEMQAPADPTPPTTDAPQTRVNEAKTAPNGNGAGPDRVSVEESFSSSTFGFGLSWHEPWTKEFIGQIADAVPPSDRLQLWNGTTRVVITGTARYGSDIAACLNTIGSRLAEIAVAGTFRSRSSGTMEIVPNSQVIGQYRVFNYLDQDGERVTVFVACAPLESRSGNLIILQNSPQAVYADQRSQVISLLEGLSIN